MDRQAWIAISLCVIGLVVWQVYIMRHPAPVRAPAPVAASPSVAAPFANASPPVMAPASPIPNASPAEPASSFTEVTETLRNSDIELRLTNRGGGIAQAVLLNHIAEENRRVTLNSGDHSPIGAIIDDPAAPRLLEYKMRREGEAVIFDNVTPEQIAIHKKFSFPATSEKKDNYIAQLDLDFQNGGEKPFALPNYYVALGSAAPNHRNDYPSYTRLVWCVNGKAKGIDVGAFTGGGGFLGVGRSGPRPFYLQTMAEGGEWTAVTNQFFTTLIVPLNAKASAAWGHRFEIPGAADTKVAGIEGAMQMPGATIAPGQTYSAHFEVYIGPKLYHRLASLGHNEAEVMEFGIFKIVCQLLLNALNSLHSVLGNYAAAILALTIIVKALLWPIQNKANRTAREMSALGPKMQELKDKHKDDPTRMNQELMKLYKEYGINPVGGCLPMVIQIPIFFGLFTMLRQAVELRNASFFWIHDLSQPDTVAHLPVLGWPINVLPLLMAATNVWLMRVTPKSGDPTQQRVMMFMPIIFVVFCYNFAAALALYYTTQNLLTILQLYLNRRQPPPKLERVKTGKQTRR